MIEANDFQSGGPGHGVFLQPNAMKRFFAEYERWMLNKTSQETSFRELLRTEVKNSAPLSAKPPPFNRGASAKSHLPNPCRLSRR